MKVDFSNGYDNVTTSPLTQWDKGQVLQIYGLDLSGVTQVHFANKTTENAIIHIAYKQGEGYSEVQIPNSLLEAGLDINAYIYITEENKGETVKTVKIPIKGRTKPADFISEPDPTQTEIIEELLAYTNKVGLLVEEANAIVTQYKAVSNIRTMTMAEYEALEKTEEGSIYAFSDDPTLDEINNKFKEHDAQFEEVDSKLKEIINGETIVGKAEHANEATNATNADSAGRANSATYANFTFNEFKTSGDGSTVKQQSILLHPRTNVTDKAAGVWVVSLSTNSGNFTDLIFIPPYTQFRWEAGVESVRGFVHYNEANDRLYTTTNVYTKMIAMKIAITESDQM